MRKNALGFILGALTAGAGLLTGGCGDPGAIAIDEKNGNAEASENTENSKATKNDGGNLQGDAATDKNPNAGSGGVWGVRQVKGMFQGGNNAKANPKKSADNPAPEDEKNAKQDDSAAAEGGVEDTQNKGWGDSHDTIQDPDFEYAVKAVRDQNYPEAKHLLLNVTKRHPESTSAWRWLGDCQYNLLELDQAIQSYQKALSVYPENYFALRGEGFSHLHLGHDFWRLGKRTEAHEEYRKALKIMQDCLRVYPGDLEAMYGRSMAAEGASRRLYQNAITQLKAGKTEVAEAEGRNCLEVIDEGIESARQRMYKNPEEIGPRSIAGGLFQRRAILQHAFKRTDEALKDMEQAVKAYQSILEINANNYLAKAELEKCKKMQEAWEKELENAPPAE